MQRHNADGTTSAHGSFDPVHHVKLVPKIKRTCRLIKQIHLRATNILDIPQDRVRDMQGYIGSIAFGVDNTTIATTSPRGGMIHLFDEQSGKFLKSHKVTDASGVAPSETSFVITSGLGVIQNLDSPKKYHKVNPRFAWDNHLVSV